MATYSFKQNILTMFIYILKNKSIKYEDYMNDYGIERRDYQNVSSQREDITIFKSHLERCNLILKNLEINHSIIEDKSSKTTHYLFKDKFEFNYENLSIKQRNDYRTIIIYLLFKQNIYINLEHLQIIFGEQFSTYTLRNERNELLGVIEETIIKEKITKSYELILDEF